MTSTSQRRANSRNAKLSTGPKPESLKHTRFNGVKHGMRARTTILPGEDPEAYNELLNDWSGELRPRSPAERRLVLEIVNAHWKMMRAERAQDELVAAGIGNAGLREEIHIYKQSVRLMWDARGPHPMYALWPFAHGGPPTSFSGQVDDPNDPHLLVKDLENSAKGCQCLLDNWAELKSRVENGLPWQPHDRLKAIRMLGKHPVHVAEDRRVRLIYATSYALHPLRKKDAYEDLQSDMGTIDYENFLKRIQARWPRELDTNDTDKAKAMLLDLIERVVERLEAIRDTHLAHAEEVAEKTARRLAIDTTTEGERMARYEMQCYRRFYKCQDAFWKHRRETSAANGEAAAGDEANADMLIDRIDGENGVVEAAVEAPAAVENQNVTSEANLVSDALEVEANQELEADDEAVEKAVADVFRTLDAEIRALIEPLTSRKSAEGQDEEEIYSDEPPTEAVG